MIDRYETIYEGLAAKMNELLKSNQLDNKLHVLEAPIWYDDVYTDPEHVFPDIVTALYH